MLSFVAWFLGLFRELNNLVRGDLKIESTRNGEDEIGELVTFNSCSLFI